MTAATETGSNGNIKKINILLGEKRNLAQIDTRESSLTIFFFSRAMKPAGKTFTLSDCVLFSLCEEKMEKRSCVCSTSALSVEREFSSCFASLFHGENLPVC